MISHWCPLSHIFRNPLFPLEQDIKAFQWWLDKGLYRIGHFVNLTGPLTFAHCTSKLDMPETERFRLQQISHFIRSLRFSIHKPLSITECELWCGQAMEQRGGVTVIFQALARAVSKTLFMREWETDLQQEWTLTEWHRASVAASKGIINIALVEANLKILMRWYMVPTRIAKIYPNASPLCFRNCGHIGSMIHIWWECPKIRGLWNKIFHIIRKITNIPIPKTPQYALLNFFNPDIPKLAQNLIRFILLGAKITIARVWKQPTVSFMLVKRKISWIMTQEKTVSILLDTVDRNDAVWEPWAKYISGPLNRVSPPN